MSGAIEYSQQRRRRRKEDHRNKVLLCTVHEWLTGRSRWHSLKKPHPPTIHNQVTECWILLCPRHVWLLAHNKLVTSTRGEHKTKLNTTHGQEIHIILILRCLDKTLSNSTVHSPDDWIMWLNEREDASWKKSKLISEMRGKSININL